MKESNLKPEKKMSMFKETFFGIKENFYLLVWIFYDKFFWHFDSIIGAFLKEKRNLKEKKRKNLRNLKK